MKYIYLNNNFINKAILKKYCLAIILLIGLNSMNAQNKVLQFDGPQNTTYDYIEVADDASLDITTQFTFETWIKLDAIGGRGNGYDWQSIIAKSSFTQSFAIMFNTNQIGVWHAGFGTGVSLVSWPTAQADTWYHLAVTLSPTELKIYINGSELATIAGTGALTANNVPLRISSVAGTPGPYPLPGSLEETRLWNVTRSAAEINSTMNTELTGSESGLVLYYKYNEGTSGGDNTSITEVVDSSTSGNNGTLHQFALNGSTSNFIENTAQNQTITFGSLSNVVYGAANFDLTATASSGFPVTYVSSNTSVATVSGSTVTIVGVGTTTITASQSGSLFYNAATDVLQNLTVTTLPIEITADAKTKYLGAADPQFTYTITSGAIVGSDTFSGSLGRVAGETLGTYAINQGTLDNANYNITFVSNDLTISAPSTITWNGGTNSNWADPTNWDIGTTPLVSNDVIITNAGTSPIIGSATGAEVNNFTVNASSSLNIEGGLIVNADFTNNGSITMTSTASASSSLVVRGASNGSVTYERGGLIGNQWSLVTAPVSGQSIKDFVENAANNIRINTTVTPNRYAVAYYDDSRPTGTKWVYYTTDDLVTNTLTFEKGRGYAISRATDGVISFTGTLETMDVNKTTTTSEWNAVGNPFTAYLPVNENGGTNFIQDNAANLDPSYVGAYIWDNSQNKYVPSLLSSSTKSLPPGQGFFVRTTAAASSIIFKESLRTTQNSGGNFNRNAQEVNPSIELSVNSEGINVVTKIEYRTEGTLGLDPGYDLGNFESSTLDVFTRLIEDPSATDFTYQSLPYSAFNQSITLGLKAFAGTEVVFTANAVNLPEDIEVYLEDRTLKKLIKLDAVNTYKIEVKENINGIGRFFLHTKSKSLAVHDFAINDIKIYNTRSELVISGIPDKDFEVAIYNIVGSKVFSGKYQADLGQTNNIPLPTVDTGMYIVRVITKAGIKNKKIIIQK